jgi:hypothetical protein
LADFSYEKKSKPKEPSYRLIGDFAREKFGDKAGYAQQLLFVS